MSAVDDSTAAEALGAGHAVPLGSASALSVGQIAFFIAYAWVLLLWATSEYLKWSRRPVSDEDSLASKEEEGLAKLLSHEEKQQGQADASQTTVAKSPPQADKHDVYDGSQKPSKERSLLADMANSNLVRCALFDLRVIQEESATLRAMAEFGTLMLWYFISDRTNVLPSAGKSYSRDLFIFLFLILTLVAFGGSLQTVKQPVLLARQQTEEWKGWMQILFLLYHYYEAKEVYNAIRLFIAAYVWMTGFGNFIYYYKTNDFSVGRFAQMMWRLNFLVTFACIVLRNSYMLYYICPMHTIFTVMVYVSLYVGSHLNKSHTWIWIKLVGCIAAVILLWDCRPVFYFIWRPFTWLMGYTDPRKPTNDVLYEWYFRSSLDRYIWIYGMLCGYLHPYFSNLLTTIDGMAPARKAVVRGSVLACSAVAGYFYFVHVYCLPKIEYNKVHPYTSWIPITLWIIVRNMTPTLRLHHLRLYGWLGCITLETYICQFHIWMKTGIPDGQPKALLSVIPEYPLLNFAVVSAMYIFVSHRLFELTNTLKNVAVPHSNNQLLLRNCLLMGSAGLVIYLTTYGAFHLFIKQIL